MIIHGRSRDSATVVVLFCGGTELTRLRTAVGRRHCGYNKIIIILYRTVVTKLWVYWVFFLITIVIKIYIILPPRTNIFVVCGNVVSTIVLRITTVDYNNNIVIRRHDVHYMVGICISYLIGLPFGHLIQCIYFVRPKVNYC